MGELAEDLAAAGHRVTVLTTTPYYNPDRAAAARQPLSRSWMPFMRRSHIGAVQVWHVLMPHRSKRLSVRVAAWAWYHSMSILGALWVPRADAVLACSPPLTIGVSAWLIGLTHRVPFVYIVQELYPDIAVRLGVLRSPFLLKVLFRLERFIYRRAAKVTAIAPGMRRRLLEKGVPAQKAILIPNFVDTGRLTPLPKDNAFAREYGLVDSFVVSYAGNMGLAQGLETLLDAAQLLREEPGIRFLILGEGVLRDAFQQRVTDEALNNVLFLPYQPFERMAEVYGASDLNLVPLAAEAGGDALPSKVYRILACGRPILALADERSDLAAFVLETGCGLVVPPGRPRELSEALRAAARDGGALAERVRQRYVAAVAAYTRPEVTRRYRRLLEGLVEENSREHVPEGSR
jgi:colanic acid biosynthesis glycosyl transferase WcaI